MFTSPSAPVPSSPHDLFADSVLDDPYPVYETLRETAPAVWLPNVAGGVWAIPRHADVHAALNDPETFSSVEGIALTEQANTYILGGTVLASDGAVHRRLRKPLSKQLNSSTIRRLGDRVEARADELVAQHVGRGRFDAAELALQLVADVVMELMGLPDQTRDELVKNAAAVFDCFGPDNRRYQEALPAAAAMTAFLAEEVSRETVTEGSWMRAMYAAADAGDIDEADVLPLMSAYTVAGMDTTIYAIASAIHLLATHPDQYAQLRGEDAPRRAADDVFHETIRLEAPVQVFGRRLTRTTTVGDVQLDQGSQALMLYGSAGRDPRRWGQDADAFRIRRPGVAGHLALGSGPHTCAGNHLAALEGRSVIAALAARCTHIELDGAPQRALNNVLRGWQHLPVTVRPAPHRTR